MRAVRSVLLASALLACASAAPPGAGAQAESGAQSTFIDPSIRAAGMGRASAAVFWGETLNDWANPALLAGRRGVRYEWSKTQLVPDLASDVYFRSRRITAGAWGVGLSLVGRPFDGLGQDYLDYGLSIATDQNGDVLGTFRSFEEIRSIGFGVSFLELYENLVRAGGGDPPALHRYGDLSIGHAWKHVVVDLAPAQFTQEGKAGRGESETADYGFLLRLTPLDSDRAGSRAGTGWGHRLDLGLAWSARNYSSSTISFIDVDQADPIAEESRLAVSAHGALTPRGLGGGEGESWLRESIQPVISVGATWERSDNSWGSVSYPGSINRWGGELTLFRIASARVGYIDDPRGTIQATTWGFGVGLNYRGIAGARYDYASVPQSRYLERLKQHEYSAYFDPIRLWSLLAGSGTF